MTGLEAVRTRVQAARRIAALTGAGMSAESGVPTFRDAQTGLWAKALSTRRRASPAWRAATSWS